MNSINFESKFLIDNYIWEAAESSCYFIYKKIQQTSQAIFSKIASLWESSEKKIDLEKCIQVLKIIPSLSQEQRMNWNSWNQLHINALTSFIFRIPGLSNNFVIPFPWCPIQIRSHLIITDDGLRTSCGVTHKIAITKLLGARDAAKLLIFGKSNQLCDLNSVMNNPHPTLLSFEIYPFDVVSGEGVKTQYGGHVWTVFKASPDRYLLITSYLHKQNAVVMELNGQEMLAHIKDIQVISDADNWTEKVDEVYTKWFGVSHGELIGLNHNQTELKKPWKVTFKSAQPNLYNINRIQEQFSQSLELPYFPKRTVLEKGDILPLDDVKTQEAFNQGNCWWIAVVRTIGLRQALFEYVSWLRKY